MTTATAPRRSRRGQRHRSRAGGSDPSPAEQLRQTTGATRVSFIWLGTRKSLSAEQKAQAASTFGAEGQFLSASKKLLDTSHPRFKEVTAVRNRTRAFWIAISLPYPEVGIRLVRRDMLDVFHEQMIHFKELLSEAVERLAGQYAQLKEAARQRLGRLFDQADYPASLDGLFDIVWDYPSVEPPPYLQQLNPQLYQQECRRVQARFDEAIQLAEQAFIEELSRLVAHLSERLSGQDNGQPKIFRDSAVGNLREFFERFRTLNIRSNQELDELVEQCQQIVQGAEPRQLRTNQVLREQVASQLAQVQSALDSLLVERPRRRILRGPRGGQRP